ncbi:hypothetical protein BD779DRAFT_1678710 [Infundibulicybe gibba]|nr:hypothetical protein BD779DRAFT_1678710 [Infundibulicybe gibba]
MNLTNQVVWTLEVIIEGIFYGAYVVLFVLYLILWRRNNRKGGLLTLAQILLFGLCTLKLCLDISADYYFLALIPGLNVGLLSMVIFALIDYLAQMILLYRCWIIWGKHRAVVAVPGFLALVTLGGGLALAGLIWSAGQEMITNVQRLTGIAVYSISLGTNVLTTSLIMIKILLTLREVRLVLGSNSHRPFHVATAMLIESGLLMLAFQLIFIISYHFVPVIIVAGSIGQIYGIAPTLLNIRVAMGSSYDETTGEILSLRFAHPEGAATRTTGLRISAAEAQSRITNEPEDASNNEGATNDAV